MRTVMILALALLVGACGSFTPVPIKAGDTGEMCGKSIIDVRFAGEVITPQGMVLKFRTPECVANYTRLHAGTVAAKYVTDYETGRFIRPESAMYVRTYLDENTREVTYAAFSQVGSAMRYSKQHLGSPIDWLQIQRMSADKKGN